MRRVFLLLVIVIMCVVVIIGGTITFVNSNSILKKDHQQDYKQEYKQEVATSPKDTRILIDVIDNKLYILNDNNIIKTYPIASGKSSTPSPIGDWIIVSKDTWGEGFGGKWMGLNVPWGKYGIHGTEQPWSIGGSHSHGCIRMRNEDINELFKAVRYGTPVKIYGGYNGAFSHGFRILKPGDRGSDVFEVQKRLKTLGYYNGYVSGIYNEEMKNAVHKFQRKNEINPSNAVGHSMYRKLGFFLFD